MVWRRKCTAWGVAAASSSTGRPAPGMRGSAPLDLLLPSRSSRAWGSQHRRLINRPQDADQALLIHSNVPNHTLSTNNGYKHSHQAMTFFSSAFSIEYAEYSGVKYKCSDLTPLSNEGMYWGYIWPWKDTKKWKCRHVPRNLQKIQSCLKLIWKFNCFCSWGLPFIHMGKGSLSPPKRMNFRKISERPLTPPAPFSENFIAIFPNVHDQNCLF